MRMRPVLARASILCGALALSCLAIPAAPAQDSPGIVVERVRASRAPEIAIGDRIITIVRVDLRRYAFRFLTEARDGARRPLDRWMHDAGLAGGINAGMFLADGRTCGFMQERGVVLNRRRPRHWQAAIAFDPLARVDPPFAIAGPGCTRDLDAAISSYGSVLQSARLLVDCAGRPQTDWRTRRYSAALLGSDREGRAVMVHVRTPYRMQHLAQMLAAPELGLRGLVYMEGGPEASLMVDAEGQDVTLIGSYEDDFREDDANHQLWDLPNVVGFAPR